MRTIAVAEGINEKGFKNFLDYILDLLELEHTILSVDSLDKNDRLDYLILNSVKERNGELSLDAGYCFANMDSRLEGNINICANMITYGVGSRNTVTFSSMEDSSEGFVYCLQRYLVKEQGENLEPQEVPIGVKIMDDTELYAAMTGITIALLEGLESSFIEKMLDKKILALT